MNTDTQPEKILNFWFGTLIEGIAADDISGRWFNSDHQFDNQCAQLCEPLLDQVNQGALDHWQDTPRHCLAFILLCDQMPRNIFRGTAQAYAFDAFALQAARRGVQQQFDSQLALDERSFFYMPFEHSEDLIDQHTAVGLFSQLRDQSPKEYRQRFGNTLRFAHQHRDVIQRFGRFPHRNKVFGRTSSPTEASFVEKGDGFGQG